MNLIEQLNDLCTKYEDSYSSAYFMEEDLRAIIEQHKSEAVEPVAVLALKNTELSNRVDVLEDLLSSAYAIANRNGENTHWGRFSGQLHVNGINPVTAKTFKILTSDPEYTTQQPDNTKLIGELVEALENAKPAVGVASDYYYDKPIMTLSNKYNKMLTDINALLTKAREAIK